MELPTYNIIDKKLTDTVNFDGSIGEASITRLLLDASEIADVTAENPLMNVGIYCLLCVIVTRAYMGFNKNRREWLKVWKNKTFDPKVIKDYLNQWHDRFDLVHPKYPFFQMRTLDKEEGSIWKLNHIDDTGASLYSYKFSDRDFPVSADCAARLLLQTNHFAMCSGGGFKTTARLALGGFSVIVKGRNLFETIMLNCFVVGLENLIGSPAKDKPLWETDYYESPALDDVVPSGVCSYLTWLSRHIKLIPIEGESLTFANMQYVPGNSISKKADFLDPFSVYKYRMDATKSKNPKVKNTAHRAKVNGLPVAYALRLNPHRSLMRDSYAFIGAINYLSSSDPRDENYPYVPNFPANLMQLSDLERNDSSLSRSSWQVDVYGLINDKASVVHVGYESFSVPGIALHSKAEFAFARIKWGEAIDFVEKVFRIFERWVTALGKLGDIAGNNNKIAQPPFWLRADENFRDFLASLARLDESQPTEQLELQAGEIINVFRKDILLTAEQVFGGLIDSFIPTSSSWKIVSTCAANFDRDIYYIRRAQVV